MYTHMRLNDRTSHHTKRQLQLRKSKPFLQSPSLKPMQIQLLTITQIHPLLHLLLNHLKVMQTLLRHQRNCVALCCRTSGASHTMNIIFRRTRQFIINHTRQRFNINKTTSVFDVSKLLIQRE